MTLRMKYIGSILSILILAGAIFLVSERVAHADADGDLGETILCDVIGEVGPAVFCEGDSGTDDGDPIPPPVDPCDIFDAYGNPLPECDGGDNDNGGGGGEEEPTDVCPNIDGVQTEVPEGKILQDGQCVNQSSEGGGGGGDSSSSGSSGGGGGGGDGGGSVLGTTTPALSCDKYINTFMRMGQTNDPEQVKRVQSVLKNFEGADVEENGEYDAKSLAAVQAFQLKYATEVLTPWGIKAPTGYVFLTTRKKLNEVYCKNTQQFPLTEEEQQHIEIVKAGAKPHVSTQVAPKPKPAMKPVLPTMPKVETVTTAEEPSDDVTSNPISNFFRRLFNRFR